eukprot:14428332-Ditylum_brightwellii.AAC.1
MHHPQHLSHLSHHQQRPPSQPLQPNVNQPSGPSLYLPLPVANPAVCKQLETCTGESACDHIGTGDQPS